MIPLLLIRIGSRYLPILEIIVSDAAVTGAKIDDGPITEIDKGISILVEITIRNRAMATLAVTDRLIVDIESGDSG